MASQVTREYESSEEEFQDTEQVENFRSSDLPHIYIPSPFHSEESSSESETELMMGSDQQCISSIPSSPATPATPTTSLGTEFSYVNLSSQTSDDGTFVAPSKPKRKYVQRKSQGRFKKGHTAYVRRSFESPEQKRAKTMSSTQLYNNIQFPRAKNTYEVILRSGGKEEICKLKPVSGNQIVNLEILGEVFSLLNCQDKSCKGRLRLYEHLLQDGLQKFLILKCVVCHNVVADFPASLPVGVSADQCINNKTLHKKGQSELNLRSLLAVHTTSQSYQDFRLACSLLDLKAPGHNMTSSSMNKLVEATNRVVTRSMDIAGENVHSTQQTTDVLPKHVRDCTVSFDASWHRRGHYSNQGFAAAIDSDYGKVLDYKLYDRVCVKCSRWPEEKKSTQPDEYAAFWEHHKADCTANYSLSSQSMESSAAIELWNRSLEKHNLTYGTYIGDGDSSSYKNVVQSDPYKGLLKVRKEECLGHVQKRLKRRLKKSTKFSKGLPEAKADRIAHLYALVIVQHRGETAAEIRDALQILLRHCEENHDHCPPGVNSWCYYQKQGAEFLDDENMPFPITREPYLKPHEFKRMEEVFGVLHHLNSASR